MFLTFIFAIMLSLVTAFIEHVRVITSEAYVTVASGNAIEMVFGNYNKELFDEYGLFAYGGYNGIGLSDFESSLEEMVNKNIEYKPDGALKPYSNLYRLTGISCETGDYYTLDEDKVFLGQISDYIITSAASDVKGYFQGKEKNDKDILLDDLLDEAEKYEDGAYNTDNGMEGGSSDSGEDNKKPTLFHRLTTIQLL